MDAIAHDLRLAWRQLVRRPLFSAVAVLTLALGMGLNVVVFSGVNGLLIKGATGSQLEGAAWIFTTGPGDAVAGVSSIELERFSEATQGALRTAAMGRTPLAWQRQGRSETVWAQLASSDYFSLLEVSPIAGRLPSTTSDASVPQAVVSERFWRQRLDSAPLANLHLTLNGIEHAVVGVMGDSFRGPGGTFAPEVWTPLARWRELNLPDTLAAPDHRWLAMIARLAPGATVAEVDARLTGAAQALAREWPATHAKRGARIGLMRDGHPELRGTIARLAMVAMAGTGVVLLLACFNVAGLLIARGVERQKEMGIRAALGAGSWRLVRQLVAEGIVLATVSGALTLIVARWSQQLLAAFALPAPIPQRIDTSVDGTVIGFVALLVVLSGVLPGLLPAWSASRVDLVRALYSLGGGGGRVSRGRHALIVVQVLGSTVLLTAAALFVQSVVRLATTDPGFETTNAVVLEMEPALQGYDRTRTALLLDRVADRIRAVPGTAGVAVAERIPFHVGSPRTTAVSTRAGDCASGGCPSIDTYAVGAGYFQTLGIAMVAGRAFDRTTSAADIVVSEALARSRWPNRSAVGQVLYLSAEGRAHIVIGVAGDVKHRSLTEATASPILYVPLAPSDFARALTVVARTDRSPGSLVRAIDDAVRQVDATVPPQSIKTMGERLELPLWPSRTATGFFAVCGVIALVLATIGLFAVVSHTVSRRTREFGVRLAIGATRGTLMRDVLAGAARLVIPGTIAGLLVAIVMAQAAARVVPGIDVRSPLTYLIIAVAQLAIALCACVVPARHAARVDPVISLRAE
jgi:putative ABC transport system permease protein